MPTSDPHPSLFRRHQVAFKAGPGPAVPTSRHGAGVTSLPPPPRHGEAVTGSFPPHTGARACTHMPTHMPTRAHTRTHAHTRVYRHTRAHICTHACTYTCTHAPHAHTWTHGHVYMYTPSLILFSAVGTSPLTAPLTLGLATLAPVTVRSCVSPPHPGMSSLGEATSSSSPRSPALVQPEKPAEGVMIHQGSEGQAACLCPSALSRGWTKPSPVPRPGGS